MAINLGKKEIVNLNTMANQINESKGLTDIGFGVDWGKIGSQKVDLDASIFVLDANKNVTEVVYYGQKTSMNSAIRHSGDDRGGDDVDDGKFNEVIRANLNNVVGEHLVLTMNSYSGESFDKLPYTRVGVFTSDEIKGLIAKTETTQDSSLKGKSFMVMGIASKTPHGWVFKSVTEGVDCGGLNDFTKLAHKYI